jgi:GH15 family glucan-1,4-alpha-glucosidase
MASKIEDYGMIGDAETVALVSKDGSVDWFCAPRFDSDACLAALVGYEEHGRWAIRPTVAVRERQQRYRGDTLILETDVTCDGGKARLTEFMPMGGHSDIIRIVEGLEGEVPFEMLLDVRFAYGAYRPWIEQTADGTRFTAGPDSLILRTPLKIEPARNGVSSYFSVKPGDRFGMELTWYPSHEAPPPGVDLEKALAETDGFWRTWAARCTYQGRYRDAVVRSLITLKAMTYAPTGGIVAAPTTSLPEEIGGVRNWDYRFCWLRDASLTLDAFMIGGYVDEARAFRDWLLRVAAGDPGELQIMYNIEGGRRLTEFELPWLPGYEGSKPVRVGNAASGQFQLDVYGEVASAIYAARKLGLAGVEQGWAITKQLLAFIEDAWQRPDDGIWEVRGGRRHFTHSKAMAWVAVDRAIRAIEEFESGREDGKAMLPHLRGLRERMRSEILERGFNTKVGAFTQSYGSDDLDASILVLPHFGFIAGSDPRMRSTVTAVEKQLLRDGFVLRYSTERGTDGLPGSEGAFLACSFWLADNYALSGRIEEAEALFDRLLSLRNHLGLLAEEYEPRLQRQIGNFPQAFSHLALILSAQIIDTVTEHRRQGTLVRGYGAEVFQH